MGFKTVRNPEIKLVELTTPPPFVCHFGPRQAESIEDLVTILKDVTNSAIHQVLVVHYSVELLCLVGMAKVFHS